MSKFSGVIAPLVTPFDEDGKLYEPGFETLMSYLSGSGVNGVFSLGSYGSFTLLELAERKESMRLVCKYAQQNELKIIMHVGHASTRYTIELAKYACDLGVDAVASVSPFYYSGHAYTEENYLVHFNALKNSVDVPVHFYNNPRTTSYTPTAKFIGDLVDVGIAGLKDSGSNMTLFAEMADVAWSKNPNFDLMPGSGSTMLAGMMLGAKSCVAGTATAFPALVVSLYKAIISQDKEQCAELQRKIVRARAIQGYYAMRPAACYSIAKMHGFNIGMGREPWIMLSDNEYNSVEKMLKDEGILTST